MSLQFIMGSSGAGKTRYLYETIIRQSIEQPDVPYVCIVPEQFTMQTQKEIVTLHPNHGTMNIDIVSFMRLAYRVFEELAVEHLEVLDDMGKSMVLRKVASEQRNNLKLFSGHLNQTGFINQLKSMLSELYQYGISPEELKKALTETKSALLKEKLKDLSVIYEAFQTAIAERYITSEEILDVLVRVLPRSQWIKNSVVTLDGYTGFTPVQYRLLELLLVHAKRVMVTVTIDPEENPYGAVEIQDLFHMSKQMVRHLTKIAEAHHIKKEQDMVLIPGKERRGRFGENSDIAFIEKNLYRYRQGKKDGLLQDIELWQAGTPAAEIDAVASRIHQLVQNDHVRYREIAVITGDLAGYRYEIVNRFQAEQIPYFMDNKKSILENVMVEFIRGALEMVQKDFSYESVFRLLKTGLVSSEQEKTDRLENYVTAMGIRGFKRWQEPWQRTYRGGKELNLVELNEFRQAFVDKFAGLKEAMGAEGKTVRSMTEALVLCLQQCRIQEQLEEYRNYFEEKGEYSLAKEYQQIYELVMGLFDRLVHLLGDEKISRLEYSQILDAGFAEITVGVIPATVDRVVVGDITRTRLDQIKVLFFVGVNEGIVPVRKENGGILTDVDREFLKQVSVELAPTSREDSFRQRFYLYLMMTKPSKSLVLSYAVLSQAGKSLRPSSLIAEMRRMFPGLAVTELKAQEKAIGSEKEGLERLIEGLREYNDSRNDSRFLELYRYFAAHPDYEKQVKLLTDAAFYAYEERGISRAAAVALYGKILQGSVTRLEQYASCAYAHFLSYGLELMERQEYQIQAVDMGNLFHDSIDLCFQQLRRGEKNVADLTDEERKALVKSCVSQVTEEYGNTILMSSARNKYLAGRIERMTDRTVWALAQQLKKGDFTPTGFEVSFSAIDNLKAMKIPLSKEEALYLKGRIDRMDLCEDERHVYIKIIDYKSGSTRFDLAAVYYGLQLQLVVYMDAVIELEERNYPGKEVVPAGIFYYNIKDPVIDLEDLNGQEKLENQEDIERMILQQLRMNGLVNSDLEVISHLDREIQSKSDIIPVAMKDGMIQERYSSVADSRRFEALRQFVRGKLKQDGREILDGKLPAAPYKQGNRTACDYCPYHGVCGFDQKVPGFKFRRFPAVKPQQIWEELLEGDEDDEVDG